MTIQQVAQYEGRVLQVQRAAENRAGQVHAS